MAVFTELGLNQTIQANITRLGYIKPTDIQEKAIGAVLSGADTYAIAPTGSGKTAAYLLPLLQVLSQNDHSEEQIRPIRALILVPTRELAQQLEQSITDYGKDLMLRTISVFGGLRIEAQFKRFKRGTDILVATPRRLLDLLKLKAFSLDSIQHFVMDEADRLVSMGIPTELKNILKAMPKKKQMILFSATDSSALTQFSQENLFNKKFIQAEENQPALDKILHTMYRCDRSDKSKILFSLLNMLNCERALIFTRTKNDVNVLTEKLIQQGFTAEGIHNEIPLKKRQERLTGFKEKTFKFLVATDIASRGIDIDDLYYVINYDLPVNPNDYIHRVGRTARTGSSKSVINNEVAKQSKSTKAIPGKPWETQSPKRVKMEEFKGHSYSLVSFEQERLVDKIGRAIGKEIQLQRASF